MALCEKDQCDGGGQIVHSLQAVESDNFFEEGMFLCCVEVVREEEKKKVAAFCGQRQLFIHVGQFSPIFKINIVVFEKAVFGKIGEVFL